MTDALDYDALDFFRGTETVADPYPYFDWLREQCPVRREPAHGVYMVTGYEEAFAVYTDPDTFSSCNSVTGPFPGFPSRSRGRRMSAASSQSTVASCPSVIRSSPWIRRSTTTTGTC